MTSATAGAAELRGSGLTAGSREKGIKAWMDKLSGSEEPVNDMIMRADGFS